MIGKLKMAVVAALLLAAGNSWALGLGQIKVKSKRNQPLVAEIPIISNTPGELRALQARLASPETFRRIGLSPPSGITTDLQFSLGSDAQGRPIIRVTTLQPVNQAVLNFLIEVDWGQGRLVREYSVLVDVPNAVSAPVATDIQAPQTPVTNVVQRPVVVSEPLPAQPEVAATQADAPVAAAEPVPPPAVAPAPVAAPAPVPVPVPAAEPVLAVEPVLAAEPAPAAVEPASAPEPAPAAAAAPSAVAVERGDTLSGIAGSLQSSDSLSLNQTMLALLQANPDAFMGGNINRLRAGATLRVPGQDEVAQIDASEATQLVHQQVQQWRQWKQTVLQPKLAAAEAATATATQPAADNDAGKPASATADDGARLRIVPPSADGAAKGTRSGTGAGEEGSMLQQELQQRDEDIAAKSAEISELKERVAALEKLKGQQQSLLSMKDTELAAAQQKLAQANSTTAANAAAATPAVAEQSDATPYLWGGAGAVVLALLGWFLLGRRKRAVQPTQRRGVFDSAALAASMNSPVQRDAATPDAIADTAADTAEPAPRATLEEAAPAPSHATQPADKAAAPAWHSAWVKTEAKQDAPAASESAEPEFQLESGEIADAAPVVEDVAVSDAAPAQPAAAPATPSLELSDAEQASGAHRLKLAKAFLDIGDEFSAQQLLLDLLDDEDTAIGDEAASLLSKLAG